MRKDWRIEFLSMALALVCALRLFARAPVPEPPAKTASPLAGTTWSGTDSDGDKYTFTFERDGTLAYKSPTGSYRNGKWSQFGGSVYFHMNNHYSEYLGEIKGDKMEGKGWNVKGRGWTWKVSKGK